MTPKSENNYGIVEYIGAKLPYTTKGYDGSAFPNQPDYEDDPEGTILYEFTPERLAYKIHTKKDQEYFAQFPERYNLILPGRQKTPQQVKAERDKQLAQAKTSDTAKAFDKIEEKEAKAQAQVSGMDRGKGMSKGIGVPSSAPRPEPREAVMERVMAKPVS